MCYEQRIGDQTTFGVMAASKNVTMNFIDGQLIQFYYEPMDTEIRCKCVENQTVPAFQTFDRPYPVIAQSLDIIVNDNVFS